MHIFAEKFSMKRLVTAFFTLLVISVSAHCQENGGDGFIDKLYIDTRAIYHQETVSGVYSSTFRADHLNLNVFGHITDKVDFRIRQRLNKQVFDENNIFNATDFVYVNWQATPKWRFLVGKNAVLIGGYEFDAVPIDVYYYSQFCSNLYQGFTLGVSAAYGFAPGQEICFQVCNSPLSLGIENVYSYNLGWIGGFTPHWRTIWTFNLVEDHDKNMISYIALGNHFQWDNLLWDVDLMNRASFAQKRYFGTDYTIITKVIWTVGKWNLCAKGGIERNSAENVDPVTGREYDVIIKPGTGYLYAGAGVEFFPLKSRENLRLHAAYYRDNSFHRNNFDLGITWRVDIIKDRKVKK